MKPDEVACSDCAETIKSAAKVCKHCGLRREGDGNGSMIVSEARQWSAEDWKKAPTGNRPPTERVSLAAKIGSVAAIAVLVLLFVFMLESEQNIIEGVDPVKQRIAKVYISGLLKDPASAKFENVHTRDYCVTGRVNARNGFGGYTGFEEFYYDAKRDAGAIQPEEVPLDLDNPSTLDAMTASTRYQGGKLACQGLVVPPTAETKVLPKTR